MIKKLYQFIDKFTFATYQGYLDVVKHISWWEFFTPKMFFKELILKKNFVWSKYQTAKNSNNSSIYNFLNYTGNLDVVKYIAQFGGNEIFCSQNVFFKELVIIKNDL